MGALLDERLEELPPATALLYCVLTAIGDDHGLFEGSPKRLNRRHLPFLEPSHLDEMLQELEQVGLVRFYDVATFERPHRVGEVTGFAAIPGQAKKRRCPSLRRQSDFPLEDGTFPAYRGHDYEKRATNANEARNDPGDVQSAHMRAARNTGAKPATHKSAGRGQGAKRNPVPPHHHDKKNDAKPARNGTGSRPIRAMQREHRDERDSPYGESLSHPQVLPASAGLPAPSFAATNPLTVESHHTL